MNYEGDTMENNKNEIVNQSKLEQFITVKVLIKMLEENGKFRRPSFSKLPVDSIIKQFEEKKVGKVRVKF
jgi:hypothetical protein